MKMLMLAYAFAFAIVVAAAVVVAATVAAETCFFDRSTVDGLNQICYYSCPSGSAAITVKAYALCPLTIKR